MTEPLKQQFLRSLAKDGVPLRVVASNPILSFQDKLFADSDNRHADIIRAGEQIRRWKAEEGDDAA